MSESKKRNLPVDIARGLAILTVVLGHQGIQTANRITFAFNLTIFFLISGFFLKNTEPLSEFIKKRARSLLVPYFFTCGIIILLAFFKAWITAGSSIAIQEASNWIFAALYGSGVDYVGWYSFDIKGIGALWFLWAMFWGLLFVRLSLKMDYRLRIVYFAILFWFGYYTRWNLWLPFSIQAGACDALYIYFGYLCKDLVKVYKDLSDAFKSTLWVVIAILWMIFYRDYTSFGVVNNTFGNGFVDFIISALSCILIFELSGWLAAHLPKISRLLIFLGRYSILILCVHNVELNLFNLNNYFAFAPLITLRSSIYLGIVWIIKIAFFTAAAWLLIRIPFIRKVFALR